MVMSRGKDVSSGVLCVDQLEFSDMVLPDASAGAASTLEPVQVGGALTNALYLTEAGDRTPITANDIHQGRIGDCFLLSAVGELATTHPDAIRNMIHDNGNGTETVTLYMSQNGSIPKPGATAFKAVSVTVDNTFPSYAANSGANQDVVGSQKEIWVQVLEKAIATLDGGYGAISNGGNPTVVMEQLTGHKATWMSAANVSAEMLKSFSAEGDLITFDTYNRSGLGYGLVPWHCYMYQGMVSTASGPAVVLKNPWGTNDPSAIPVSQLSKVFAEIDVGRFT